MKARSLETVPPRTYTKESPGDSAARTEANATQSPWNECWGVLAKWGSQFSLISGELAMVFSLFKCSISFTGPRGSFPIALEGWVINDLIVNNSRYSRLGSMLEMKTGGNLRPLSGRFEHAKAETWELWHYLKNEHIFVVWAEKNKREERRAELS